MLFFLLDLCRESWLLLELLPSAERLEGTKGNRSGGELNKDEAVGLMWGCLTCGTPGGRQASLLDG